MNSKDDPQPCDIHLGVMLVGCGITLIVACLSFFLRPLLYDSGLDSTNRDALVVLLQAVAWLVAGYGTARATLWKKVPVNLHVFALAVFLMLVQIVFGILQLTTDEAEVFARLPYSFSQFLLTVPLMLLGAGIARWKNNSWASHTRISKEKHGI